MLYFAFGLSIATELALPELPVLTSVTTSPDVDIHLGPLPVDGWGDRARIGLDCWATGDDLLLIIPGIARFRASNGCSITVDPEPGADADSIRLFLLGSVLGAILLQRDMLLLHGCAVDVGGRALIAVGHSGVGKSTLAEGFRRRGHAVLTDDLVAINGNGNVVPGIPRIKLWHDVTDHLAIDRDPLPRIRPHMDKFGLAVGKEMAPSPLTAAWIYSLGVHNKDKIVITPIGGFDRVGLLLEHSYRASFVKGMNRRHHHLARTAQLASRVTMGKVQRPDSGFMLTPLIDALLADAHR